MVFIQTERGQINVSDQLVGRVIHSVNQWVVESSEITLQRVVEVLNGMWRIKSIDALIKNSTESAKALDIITQFQTRARNRFISLQTAKATRRSFEEDMDRIG